MWITFWKKVLVDNDFLEEIAGERFGSYTELVAKLSTKAKFARTTTKHLKEVASSMDEDVDDSNRPRQQKEYENLKDSNVEKKDENVNDGDQ